jgi:hypothetical protein
VHEGTEITISLGGDRLRGSAGCNSYEGAYAQDGSTLTMESMAVTEMACLSPEGVMEQEARYLGLLKDVSAYHVYGGQLWLEMGDGRALVFAVKAQPLTVALQPTDILVQLGWEGGFTPPEASVPFGRVPELTLLADGSLFYVDYGDPLQPERQQTLYAQLTPVEAQALVQRVLDLGFERLESYMDYCRQLTDGTSLCVADAGTSVLRVRLPGGDLRETRNYADFANDPEALAAIRTLLSEYRHPGAQPYLPEKATLFIRPLASASDATLPEWPLDPAWLTPPDSTAEQWARVLAGEDRDRLLAVTSRNMGNHYLRYANRPYEVVLVPWLPGVDYTNMVASYRWP